MTNEAFGLRTIGQIAITARDLERAVAFYRDALGMTFLFSTGQLAFFDCDGVRLMLSAPENAEQDHPSSVLYFSVPDLGAAFRTLRERGVTFEDEPHVIANMGSYDLWMAFFRDSERNVLALMSEVPHE